MSVEPLVRCCVEVHPPDPELPAGVEALAADTALSWPNGSTLRVAFADGDIYSRIRWFAAAEEWEAVANIRFGHAYTGPYDILVTFKGPPGTYYSYLGTEARQIPRGTPTMVLAGLDQEDADFRRVALHEIGHALGCVHEHQSPAAGIPWDREKIYAWYQRTQGWSREEIDAQVFDRYSEPSTQYTEWDRLSIMEYPIDGALLTDPSFACGWNRELTPTDKAFIARCYPGRGETEAEPTPDPETPTVPEPPPAWASSAPLASPERPTMSDRLNAAAARARTWCLKHPSIVTGACAALGLALTGHVSEAVTALSFAVLGRANGSISALLKPR